MHTLPKYVNSNASGTSVITFGNMFIIYNAKYTLHSQRHHKGRYSRHRLKKMSSFTLYYKGTMIGSMMWQNTLKMQFIHTYSAINTKQKGHCDTTEMNLKKIIKSMKTSKGHHAATPDVSSTTQYAKIIEPIIVSDSVYTGCGLMWRENDATLYVWCTLWACVTFDNSPNGSGTIVASGLDMVLFVIDPTKPTMEQRKFI